jgi:hypothetical protein
MKSLLSTGFICAVVLLLAGNAAADLALSNGGFDNDADLGPLDDPILPPTGWFTHYTDDQTWSDFRFGNDGNGGWDNNGISLGQNFTGPNFDPGPEDGYFYSLLGQYRGEVSTRVNGFGYNRSGRPGNPPGDFEVSFYRTAADTFTAANGTDVATGRTPLATTLVDLSTIAGSTPASLPFSLGVTFAGSGINTGDSVWLRFGDGPDDMNLATFDEPIIDNLTLTTVVPEPSAPLLLAWIAALCGCRGRRGLHA